MFKVGDMVKYVMPNNQIGGIGPNKEYIVERVDQCEFNGVTFLKVVGNKHVYYAWRFVKAVTFKGNK